MSDFGFIRVAAVTPSLQVTNCIYNATKIIDTIESLSDDGAALIVFPELCITGYTCGDLFLQKTLQKSALNALLEIATETKKCPSLIVLGLPVTYKNCLYNCAAILQKGQILALIPKVYIPNYNEFYEARYFTSGVQLSYNGEPHTIYINEKFPQVPFGTNILVSDKNNEDFVLGVEICEDLWSPISPSTFHCQAGATVIACPSASNEIIGKAAYRKTLISGHSAKNICAYIYCDAGVDESTSDLVFSNNNLIYENGTLLKEAKLFATNSAVTCDIDCQKITQERRRQNTFPTKTPTPAEFLPYIYIPVELPIFDEPPKKLRKIVSATPFVPVVDKDLWNRAAEVITLQSHGLAKRIRHIGCKNVVLGLSGGLDSTLALIICLYAFELCDLDKKGITAVVMRGPGTSERTNSNAVGLAKSSQVSLLEIPISNAVTSHLGDIACDLNKHDTTYENAQARERTQILMDVANKLNGIVIGTGDLSELALGWCTYNGDHMSMYAVNSSIPKTLVRHLVRYVAKECGGVNDVAQKILLDILDTPVTPELLPTNNGEISQRTEDLVGPYELHDFFLYYTLRYGFSPAKILYLADKSTLQFSHEEKLKWIRVFYKRFFSQQFKRNCLPDGAKVGTVSLSPRGDFRAPSDAVSRIWDEAIFNIE